MVTESGPNSPTLRRGAGSGSKPVDDETKPADPDQRPTLKRRDGGN